MEAARDTTSPAGGCSKCHGTGFTLRERDGYSYAAPCDCRAARSRSLPVPPRFQDKRFDTFATPNPSLKRAKGIVQEFSKAYPDVSRGFFLMGHEGVGKTHLVSALLMELADNGFVGLYYDFRDLLQELRGSYDRESGLSTSEVLEPITQAPLVVIDGVGDERPTDWVTDTLSHIINRRYNDKRVTIATSRFFDERTLGELGDASAKRKSSGPSIQGLPLEERIGAYLISRFYEMCQFVPMVGVEDFRIRIMKESQ